jgi:hypothetical protein
MRLEHEKAPWHKKSPTWKTPTSRSPNRYGAHADDRRLRRFEIQRPQTPLQIVSASQSAADLLDRTMIGYQRFQKRSNPRIWIWMFLGRILQVSRA